jgi:1-acyl-sn-glycerol-3-phosphate acyltransferase
MTGTMISNHVTQHDAMIITQYLNNSFALDISFKKIPLMGSLAQMVDGIFVPRAGSDEARQKIMEIIAER